MKSREISRSKISHGPKLDRFYLACTDPYIGIGLEYQSSSLIGQNSFPLNILRMNRWNLTNLCICIDISKG